MFFAPTQIRKRSHDWGRDGLDQRFADVARERLDVRTGAGAEGLRHAWLEVLDGRTPPRAGHVIRI